LYNYLNHNNILVGDQCGFREKLSTETAIYTLLNNVLSSFDRRNLVGCLFCDLQKAFDCVNHEILLAKIKFYGISGIANKLMVSHLENRYQRVSENNSKPNKLSSKWVHVKHGVPQDSILGPLLFLIYINDLSLSINQLANPILFADDTTIIISNTIPEEFKNNINSVMTEITNWFQSNLLTMNCNKTHFMQFLTEKQHEKKIEIIAPNSINTNINSTKFPGLIIDNSLSWKDHIAALTSKLNKACYAIRSIKLFLSVDLLIYFSYVHSVMSYGIIFGGNSHPSNSIFKLKKNNNNHYKYQ